MRKTIIIIMAAISCRLGSPAYADPGPIVTYAMDTEVSLFSFGLYRLDERLAALSAEHAAGFAATYDWSGNRIQLHAISFNRMAATRDNCATLIRAIRQRGAVNPDSGKYIWGDHSLYASLFAPIGYSLKNEPDDYRAKLDQIMVVKAAISNGEETVSCEGPLVSNRVLFEGE